MGVWNVTIALPTTTTMETVMLSMEEMLYIAKQKIRMEITTAILVLLDTLVSFFQLWIILTQLHVINIQLFWFSALYSYFSFFSHSKVDMEEDIWRRDCFSPDDGFVGCKQDSRNNGSSSWNIEICVCEGSLCNIKMGDISTSTSKSTTHKGKHWFIICFHWLDIILKDKKGVLKLNLYFLQKEG